MRNKIFILLAMCLALSSCAAPSKEVPTESLIPPTATIEPTVAPTISLLPPTNNNSPTIVSPSPPPIASPSSTPPQILTIEYVEKKLETELDIKLDYVCIQQEYYVFTHENDVYRVRTDTGDVCFYRNKNTERNPKELYNKSELKELAIEKISKYCLKFFESDYIYEITKPGETVYGIMFYQISKKGNKTGNTAYVDILWDGSIYELYIHNFNNPNCVDADYTISKDEAINIAYNTVKEKISSTDTYGYSSEIYFDNHDGHEIEANIICNNGKQMWEIKVINMKIPVPNDFTSLYLIINFDAYIDSNTGEIIKIKEDRKLVD